MRAGLNADLSESYHQNRCEVPPETTVSKYCTLEMQCAKTENFSSFIHPIATLNPFGHKIRTDQLTIILRVKSIATK